MTRAQQLSLIAAILAHRDEGFPTGGALLEALKIAQKLIPLAEALFEQEQYVAAVDNGEDMPL